MTRFLVPLALVALAVPAPAQGHFYTGCQKRPCKKHVWRTAGYRPHLLAIRSCESGGNYRAISQGGLYRGAFQFDHQTFASVGGSGDPAVATRVEQNYRATILYGSRGAQPWPVCGRGGA